MAPRPMNRLHGVITDRLHQLFPPDSALWNPPRSDEATPLPATGVEGIPLTGRHRKDQPMHETRLIGSITLGLGTGMIVYAVGTMFAWPDWILYPAAFVAAVNSILVALIMTDTK